MFIRACSFRLRDAVRRCLATISDRGGAIIIGASGQEIHLPAAEEAVTPTYRKSLYCPVTQTLRTSTHVGTDDTNTIVRGMVGDVGSSGSSGSSSGGGGTPTLIEPELAKRYARNAGLRLLATIHHALDGDLGRVRQVTKLVGIVHAAADFTAHGAVVNGCSEVRVVVRSRC